LIELEFCEMLSHVLAVLCWVHDHEYALLLCQNVPWCNRHNYVFLITVPYRRNVDRIQV